MQSSFTKTTIGSHTETITIGGKEKKDGNSRGGRERERERERGGGRGERERQTDRQTEKEVETDIWTTDRQRQRQMEKQADRQTDKQRQRDRRIPKDILPFIEQASTYACHLQVYRHKSSNICPLTEPRS